MKRNNDFGLLVKQIRESIEKVNNKGLSDYGLTNTQVYVLLALSDADNHTLSLKELEKGLGVSQPTMVGIINRLEEKKLVKKIDNPTKARAKDVVLLENGLINCKDFNQVLENTENILIKGFSPEEKVQLLGYLKRMHENIGS